MELSRSRHTIAIPMMTAVAAWDVAAEKPVLQLRDFSETVTRALNEYVEKHHPGSLQRAVDKIRAYKQPDDPVLKVAEDGPSVDELAAGETTRRRKPAPGAGAKAPASARKPAHS